MKNDSIEIKKFNGEIETFNAENEGYEIITIFQFADMLDERIQTLSKNLIIGLLLILIILGFFLSFRLSLWVAFGIPTALMATLAVMLLTGQTINMVSLFALILTLGIIVDDAIVVSANGRTSIFGGAIIDGSGK